MSQPDVLTTFFGSFATMDLSEVDPVDVRPEKWSWEALLGFCGRNNLPKTGKKEDVVVR